MFMWACSIFRMVRMQESCYYCLLYCIVSFALYLSFPAVNKYPLIREVIRIILTMEKRHDYMYIPTRYKQTHIHTHTYKHTHTYLLYL
jgi:hypothetical protein